MGQEDSKPQISHKNSPRNVTFVSGSARKTLVKERRTLKRIQCEGMLKLQTTPFKNCVEIETQNETLFLENVQVTLKQLLQTRLNTNKLFLVDDVERLIEGVTFTLAYLQEKGVTYKDIDAENIFYDNGTFKMLPNELLCLNTYQKLKDSNSVLPSPQLIIALRCGQQDVQDEDILEKSNVFTLGMVILEVCTLLPSQDCYDTETYDILDAVINQRVLLVQEYYGERMAKIVANMLDYDYTERMNLKQLSIWINRQMQHSKASESTNPEPQIHSILASKVEKNSESKINHFQEQKSRVKLAKNNSVYMNTTKDGDVNKQQRNKIYINDTSRQQQIPRVFQRQTSKQTFFANRRKDYRPENIEKNMDRLIYSPQTYQQPDSFKVNQSISKQIKQGHPYQFNQDYKLNIPRKQNNYQKSLIDRETVTKRITKQPIKPYRNQNQTGKMFFQGASEQMKPQRNPLRDVSNNNYYPSVDEILKSKPASNSIQIKGPLGENGSLNRIKQQILKSRKLIEQFKRNEGIKY